MTQETRETLTKMLERGGVDCGRPCAEFYPEEIAALRDVLTPRTCGNCRHWQDLRHVSGPRVGICNSAHLYRADVDHVVRANDGCLLGWQAREGETS